MRLIAEGDLLPDREFDPAIFNMYSEYTPEQGTYSYSLFYYYYVKRKKMFQNNYYFNFLI